nr:PREDICTED: CMRF35-like molecule 7 [Rhinolophus sinicus]
MSGERETKDARALSLRERMGKVDRGEGGCEVSARGWPGRLGTLVQALDICLGPPEPRRLPGQDWLRGGGSMYILGLCFAGCFSIQGPESVRGPEQGSLTVQCRYDPKWKNYVKWWCRGKIWDSCNIRIQTTGSEQNEMGDRVSIRDNQRDHFFTVTMKELRRDDQDIYWCGIQRFGTDLGVSIKVNIDPGKKFLVYTLRP